MSKHHAEADAKLLSTSRGGFTDLSPPVLINPGKSGTGTHVFDDLSQNPYAYTYEVYVKGTSHDSERYLDLRDKVRDLEEEIAKKRLEIAAVSTYLPPMSLVYPDQRSIAGEHVLFVRGRTDGWAGGRTKDHNTCACALYMRMCTLKPLSPHLPPPSTASPSTRIWQTSDSKTT